MYILLATTTQSGLLTMSRSNMAKTVPTNVADPGGQEVPEPPCLNQRNVRKNCST